MTDYERGQRDILDYLKAQTMLILKRGGNPQDVLLDLINLLQESRPFKD